MQGPRDTGAQPATGGAQRRRPHAPATARMRTAAPATHSIASNDPLHHINWMILHINNIFRYPSRPFPRRTITLQQETRTQLPTPQILASLWCSNAHSRTLQRTIPRSRQHLHPDIPIFHPYSYKNTGRSFGWHLNCLSRLALNKEIHR